MDVEKNSDNKRIEWKKRMQWTALVLLVFVLMALVGSIMYRYTGGGYTPLDAFRDFGFEESAE
jgi:hypothetical protein